MLLSMNEISTALAARFSHFDGEMDDMILTCGGFDITEIERLERDMAVVFPGDFKDFLMCYNLNNFSLGSVVFGHGGHYIDKLRGLNSRNELSQWWGKGERPADLFVIAYNDPYTICLNTGDSKVYAVTSGSVFTCLKPVAKNFTLFFRGVASAFLNPSLASFIEIEVGSQCSEFWIMMR